MIDKKSKENLYPNKAKRAFVSFTINNNRNQNPIQQHNVKIKSMAIKNIKQNLLMSANNKYSWQYYDLQKNTNRINNSNKKQCLHFNNRQNRLINSNQISIKTTSSFKSLHNLQHFQGFQQCKPQKNLLTLKQSLNLNKLQNFNNSKDKQKNNLFSKVLSKSKNKNSFSYENNKILKSKFNILNSKINSDYQSNDGCQRINTQYSQINNSNQSESNKLLCFPSKKLRISSNKQNENNQNKNNKNQTKTKNIFSFQASKVNQCSKLNNSQQNQYGIHCQNIGYSLYNKDKDKIPSQKKQDQFSKEQSQIQQVNNSFQINYKCNSKLDMNPFLN